ncbi:MAG: class I SAM-dependent methyltransferase [Actinobacteria bacterium]|nr:class I SAM-dependent methyltransferase [Actinomycetota bacterium]
MSHNELNWSFAEEFAVETSVIARARALSLEYGVAPISPAVGAQMAILAASLVAKNIIEVGTGLGVSGLWLLRGAPEASLTSIDHEFEYHDQAKMLFAEAGIPHQQLRLITGHSSEVLPRMNENSYDIVVVDSDPAHLLENVEHSLRLVRVGGLVLLPHALWHGEVANPAQRGDIPAVYRSVLTLVSQSEAVLSALSPAGDGLLQLSRVN